MKLTIKCNSADVITDERFIEKSTYTKNLINDIGLQGKDSVELEAPGQEALIVEMAVAWCESGQITSSFEGRLVDECAKSMTDFMRAQRTIIRNMVQPLQLKFLDSVDSKTFAWLRNYTRPADAHYHQQLCNLLHNNHFSHSLNNSAARNAYETVLKVQSALAEQMVNGRLTKNLDLGANRVEFSPDGRYLCTRNTKHILVLWDLLSPSMNGLWSCDGVCHFKFGVDSLLITSHMSNTVKVWSIAKKVVLHDTLNVAQPHQIVTTKDYLLVVEDKEAKMWKWSSLGTQVDTPLFNGLSRVCLSPDGQFFVSDSVRPGGLRFLSLHHVESGKLIQLQPAVLPVSALLVSGDSTLIAAVSRLSVNIWHKGNVENPIKEVWDEAYKIRAASFSPDSSYLVIAWSSGKVSLLSRKDSFQELSNYQGRADPISDLAWSPDGRFIAIASRKGITIIAKKILKQRRTGENRTRGDTSIAARSSAAS